MKFVLGGLMSVGIFVDIGSIWEYQDRANPFSESIQQLVLDKKGGWIKYIDVKGLKKIESHENISEFIKNRKLVK